MSLFWPCLLLLFTLYLVVINRYSSEALEGYNCVCAVVVIIVVVVVVNVGVVYLVVVTGHIIFSCGQ